MKREPRSPTPVSWRPPSTEDNPELTIESVAEPLIRPKIRSRKPLSPAWFAIPPSMAAAPPCKPVSTAALDSPKWDARELTSWGLINPVRLSIMELAIAGFPFFTTG